MQEDDAHTAGAQDLQDVIGAEAAQFARLFGRRQEIVNRSGAAARRGSLWGRRRLVPRRLPGGRAAGRRRAQCFQPFGQAPHGRVRSFLPDGAVGLHGLDHAVFGFQLVDDRETAVAVFQVLLPRLGLGVAALAEQETLEGLNVGASENGDHRGLRCGLHWRPHYHRVRAGSERFLPKIRLLKKMFPSGRSGQSQSPSSSWRRRRNTRALAR